MLEWTVILISGAAGGFVGSFLPAGTDVAFPAIIDKVMPKNTWVEFASHAVRNSAFGALAGFLLWAGYTPGVAFSDSAVAPNQVAMAIIFGGAGITVVNNLFRQAERSADLSRALDAWMRL